MARFSSKPVDKKSKSTSPKDFLHYPAMQDVSVWFLTELQHLKLLVRDHS
jgi:hypothetical protein